MCLGGKQKNQQRAESKPKFARSGEQNEAGLFFKELRALNVEGGASVQVFECSGIRVIQSRNTRNLIILFEEHNPGDQFASKNQNYRNLYRRLLFW